MIYIIRLFLAVVFFTLQLGGVWAAPAALKGAPVQATLVPEVFDLHKGTGRVFLILTLQKGWKVYGPSKDADQMSYSPHFTWADSTNVADVQATWPATLEARTGNLVSHVYRHTVIVPLDFQARAPGQPVLLKGTLEALACSSSSCRPLQIPLTFEFQQALTQENAQARIQKIITEAATPEEKEGVSLWTILLFAFLGGCLLNVMPCVLPVLGVKLLVFAKGKPGACRIRELWMTAAGIYATFMVFAAGTQILKALGETVGWGAHFQNPYFLSFMVVVLILFTANMWGFFEFAVPTWAQKASAQTRGSDGPQRQSWRSFFSGVLSVLLATPCTTPFVGTAVGFALARDALEIYAVFSIIAVGFSSPYWITALLPSHRMPLPRPGPWIMIFQRVLGVLLLGTIAWLLFLLGAHQPLSHLIMMTSLVLISFVFFWLCHTGKAWARIPTGLVLCALLGAPFLPNTWLWGNENQTPAVDMMGWLPFHPNHIAHLVTKGKTVFVDLTASWCLTCHLNKKMVLNATSLAKILASPDVIRMRGDWTTRNDLIPPFLQQFGRSGIPCNVIFGPGAPEGILLPEILTAESVLEALKEARN